MKYLMIMIGLLLSACDSASGPDVVRSAKPCTGEALLSRKEAASAADVVVKGQWSLSEPDAIADGFVAIGKITPKAVIKGDFDNSVPVSMLTGDVAAPTGETVQCAVSKPDPTEVRIFFLRRAEKYYEVVDHRSGRES